MLETRRARRYDCNETADVEARGRVRLVFLRDVSMLGARLQGTDLPEVGSLIRVSPSFSQAGRVWVFAQVCWVRRGEVEEAGIRFMEPLFRLQNSWVGRFVAGKDSAERRRAIRVPTDLHFELKLPKQRRPLEGNSVDLSRGGAQIVLPDETSLRPGELAEVAMCLPWCMIEVPAQIVPQPHNERGHHSLRFLEMGAGEGDALDNFLREQISTARAQLPLGTSFLKLLNG